MSAPAAIRGTFADFKIIRGRKVAQFVVEVPIEESDVGLQALGGLPRPDMERWVAIARLAPEAAQRASLPQQATLSASKVARPFASLPYAQQTALKCGDAEFRSFLGVDTEEQAATAIRHQCGVLSRANIKNSPYAIDQWHAILNDYDRHIRGAH